MYSGLACVLAACLAVCEGYNHFKYRIPNGDTVIHPCHTANILWYGVGHESQYGGGPRNPFGEDFARYGYRWNRCLCELDSDGDGLTNGQELGDPDCVWEEGAVPGRSTGITHPGVCTPLDSTSCTTDSSFVDCEESTEFECDAIEAEDVETVSVRFPETAVPESDTTYYCMAFDLPTDGDYHLIAATPEIDNTDVMHHIILYGCKDEEEEVNARQNLASPVSCEMTECDDFLVTWAIGLHGQCFDPVYGIRIGQQGYKVVVMELHWNNPERKNSYTDSSGLTLHYTPNRRQYDGAPLFVGPVFIQIPPGYLDLTVEGHCSSDCISSVLGGNTIYLAELLPHMHYLGSAFKLELLHDGVVTTLYETTQYFYDSPDLYKFPEHVAVEPGDELRVSCTFASKARNEFTYFGLATSDEMCFAIMMYYPFQEAASGLCMMTDGYGNCFGNFTSDIPPEVCDLDEVEQVITSNFFSVLSRCDPEGTTCRPTCESALAPVNALSCISSPVAPTVKALYSSDSYGQMFLNAMASCDPKPQSVPGDEVSDGVEQCPDAAVSYLTANGAFAVVSLGLLGILII